MSNQTNSIDSGSDVVATMRHVTRFFENPGFVRALTNVTFEVRRGEIFGVLGPKGSGKSTTLRILAGVLSTSEGKARVFGRSPRWRSVKSRIGYLPEGDGSAANNLFGRILSFLPQLLVRNRSGAAPNALRASRRRRATLAQILSKAPDLIILDEPFSGLDTAGCAELKELLLALVRRGRTIVLSSDSLCETRDICTRMAVLYAGSVQAIGALPELLTHPEAIRFTAPLLPPDTAKRVLETICRDLTSSDALKTFTATGSTDEAQLAQPANSGSSADDWLSLLLKNEVSPLVEPAAPSVRINHDKLASLTRRTES
jgi:ABC-2 type transport system ATP-binding protein